MPSNVDKHGYASRPPLPVQILTIIFYAGFAISVSIVAMALFGIIGIALAAFFAWQWGQIPNLGGRIPVKEAVEQVRPVVDGGALKESGNKSFDAYKQTLLDRLEKEQVNFDQFLDRLRTSKDRAEFDQFMDQRADKAREITEAPKEDEYSPKAVGTPLPA